MVNYGQVEEIGDVDGASRDPFVADAIANERDLSLTLNQMRNFKKVDFFDTISLDSYESLLLICVYGVLQIKEEDDVKDDLKLRRKETRRKKRSRKVCFQAYSYSVFLFQQCHSF